MKGPSAVLLAFHLLARGASVNFEGGVHVVAFTSQQRLLGPWATTIGREGCTSQTKASFPTPITRGTVSSSLAAYPPRKNRRGGKNGNNNEDEDSNYDPILDEPEGRRGDGRNWIEKSSPLGIGKLVEGTTDITSGPSSESSDEKEMDGNYDLKVDGTSFQTGSLSKRMYEALMSVATKRFPPGSEIPSEIQDVYKIYAMDITAKEAVKAALDQNGLELAIDNNGGGQNEDEGLWGDVDFVQLIDSTSGNVEGDGYYEEEYDSFDTAVEEGDWEPGQSFTFIIRNVPARLKEMDISDLLAQLDPEGELRDQAKEKGITMPDEDVVSLSDLGKECDRRVKLAPFDAQDAANAYRGNGSKGYNTIHASDLLVESGNADGTENDATLMHVMNALVSHSCLVVDLTNGGTKFDDAIKISKMWRTSELFFEKLQAGGDAMKESLPAMHISDDTGSPHAVTGFSSFKSDGLQVLETRIVRGDGKRNIVPEETVPIIGEDGVNDLIDAFDVMCETGKDIVRIAVAAANMEYGGFMGSGSSGSGNTEDETSDIPMISGLTFDDTEIAGIIDVDDDDEEGKFVDAARLSSEAAALLTEELIDDGKDCAGNSDQGNVSMSPHRICRYEGKEKDQSISETKENFGAHTDTSFLTLVPVAAINGLEIFDEDANAWLRPELLARQAWEDDRKKRGLDPTSHTENVKNFDGDEERQVNLPWYSRYVVAMPGELLQIATRNEIAASVHRVVSVTNGDARISAPVLLRARSGMRMNLSKYFGNSDTHGSLLKECNGMKLEDVHNALQPSSYRK